MLQELDVKKHLPSKHQQTKQLKLIIIYLVYDFYKSRTTVVEGLSVKDVNKKTNKHLEELDVMLKESVSGTDIIKSMQKEIWNLQIDNELKVRLTEKTGEIEFRLVEGSDEFVQLEALLAGFVLAGKGIIN